MNGRRLITPEGSGVITHWAASQLPYQEQPDASIYATATLKTEVHADREVVWRGGRYQLRAIVENAPMGERLTELLARSGIQGYLSAHPRVEFKRHFVTHVRFVCTREPDAWVTCDNEWVENCDSDPPMTATQWCTMLWYHECSVPAAPGPDTTATRTPLLRASGASEDTQTERDYRLMLSKHKPSELNPCTLQAMVKAQHAKDPNIGVRVAAADGQTVEDALLSPSYTISDLRYDIRHGYISLHEPSPAADQHACHNIEHAEHMSLDPSAGPLPGMLHSGARTVSRLVDD